MRTVNVKGESTVNGSKCTMERTSPWPRTVTEGDEEAVQYQL